MRIVAGRWAGRDLVSPGGRVRPTAEEVRVAWMELLGDRIEGARVLDLYAGTGALGLEALSRGARSADFVENSPSALHALKANTAAIRARGGRARVFRKDALRWVHRLGPDSYDVVLADPPYGSRQADRLIEHWLRAPYSALLSVEHAADHRLPARGRVHRFGDSAITTYEAADRR